MGLYSRIEKELPEQFSIFQAMKLLSMDEEDFHEMRNICKQWYQQGLITRKSKNMYSKVKK